MTVLKQNLPKSNGWQPNDWCLWPPDAQPLRLGPMVSRPIKVICVVEYFLPGYKGGGPIRTIANMRQLLAADVDIAIFTRDRDLGSAVRYGMIRPDRWTETEDGAVYYASPGEFSANGLKRAIRGQRFDLLYLNSFFGFRSSIQMYLGFRRALPHIPILLAPRGEFSLGALAIKYLKKRVFLTFSKALGLYRDINWHASTAAERDDILRQFPAAAGQIYLAEDPVVVGAPSADGSRPRPSPSGQLRLAFISRISPMKNLDGLLLYLAKTSRWIELDIYGPIEDRRYWRDCQRLIAELPPNVSTSYKGALNPETVKKAFADYELFALPSHGENFGHVIFEALCAGTPVLLSDRTPWRADPSGAVSVVPLTEAAAWSEHLCAAADRTADEKGRLRYAARSYAENFVFNSGIAEKNLSMFLELSGRGNGRRGQQNTATLASIDEP